MIVGIRGFSEPLSSLCLRDLLYYLPFAAPHRAAPCRPLLTSINTLYFHCLLPNWPIKLERASGEKKFNIVPGWLPPGADLNEFPLLHMRSPEYNRVFKRIRRESIQLIAVAVQSGQLMTTMLSRFVT